MGKNVTQKFHAGQDINMHTYRVYIGAIYQRKKLYPAALTLLKI